MKVFRHVTGNRDGKRAFRFHRVQGGIPDPFQQVVQGGVDRIDAVGHDVPGIAHDVGNLTDPEGEKPEHFVGSKNEAVKAVFGSEGEKDADGNMQNKQCGNVLMSDIIKEAKLSPKILNHVSIDRFTGGAIDGALFNEETLYAQGMFFELRLVVNNVAFEDKDVKTAFEKTLEDLIKFKTLINQ